MSDIPTSGTISLNQMHTEVDGTSGTQVSLNDADIRGLISKAAGVAMSFNEWYGASSSLDVQTVTVGYNAGTSYTPSVYGYLDLGSGATGSVSDGTCNFKSGAALRRLQWNSNNILMFALNGTHTNSGWTTMTIGSTSYSRSSASFVQFGSSPTVTRWEWSGITTNPYGTTTGATRTVTFT